MLSCERKEKREMKRGSEAERGGGETGDETEGRQEVLF